MIIIADEAQFNDFIQSEQPACAVFSADWCPDCQVLKAVLPGIEEEYSDRMSFAMVDRDKHPNLARKYDVMGIPSLVVFRRGEVIGSFISKFRKTRAQITDFLDGLYSKI